MKSLFVFPGNSTNKKTLCALLMVGMASTLFPATSEASRFRCNISAADMEDPHARNDKDLEQTIYMDGAHLQDHGGRVIKQKDMARCGGAAPRKNERAALKKMRKSKIALACYCSNVKGGVGPNAPAAAATGTSAINAAQVNPNGGPTDAQIINNAPATFTSRTGDPTIKDGRPGGSTPTD